MSRACAPRSPRSGRRASTSAAAACTRLTACATSGRCGRPLGERLGVADLGCDPGQGAHAGGGAEQAGAKGSPRRRPPRRPAQPNVFHFWERYESNVVLGRVNTAPEVIKFMETVGQGPGGGGSGGRRRAVEWAAATAVRSSPRRRRHCMLPAAAPEHGRRLTRAPPRPRPPARPRQVVPLLEKPVGMALYEWQNGQLGPVCLQGGARPRAGPLRAAALGLARAPAAAPGGTPACNSRAFQRCCLSRAPRAPRRPQGRGRP
jgi:hypothetical protein